MAERAVVLMDTNAIIEAVRTSCWRAIAGRFHVETVEECREEARRGDAMSPAYVSVSENDLALLADVHAVTKRDRARLALECEFADGLDDGERDLLAHAIGRDDDVWLLCSPDKASVRAAVDLECGDRLISLGELSTRAGVRPKPAMQDHFSETRLQQWRTAARLGTL